MGQSASQMQTPRWSDCLSQSACIHPDTARARLGLCTAHTTQPTPQHQTRVAPTWWQWRFERPRTNEQANAGPGGDEALHAVRREKEGAQSCGGKDETRDDGHESRGGRRAGTRATRAPGCKSTDRRGRAARAQVASGCRGGAGVDVPVAGTGRAGGVLADAGFPAGDGARARTGGWGRREQSTKATLAERGGSSETSDDTSIDTCQLDVADASETDVGPALGEGLTAREERECFEGFVATKDEPMPLVPSHAANLPAWRATALQAAAKVTKEGPEQRASRTLLEAEDEAAVAKLCTVSTAAGQTNSVARAARHTRMDAALRVVSWQVAAQRPARGATFANDECSAVMLMKVIAKIHVRKAAEAEAICNQLMSSKTTIPVKMPTAACANAIVEVIEAKVARIRTIVAADPDHGALAVPVRHVVDELVALTNDIREFSDDSECQAKATIATNTHPLKLDDVVEIVTDRAGATPDRPVTLVEDAADVDAGRGSGDRAAACRTGRGGGKGAPNGEGATHFETQAGRRPQGRRPRRRQGGQQRVVGEEEGKVEEVAVQTQLRPDHGWHVQVPRRGQLQLQPRRRAGLGHDEEVGRRRHRAGEEDCAEARGRHDGRGGSARRRDPEDPDAGGAGRERRRGRSADPRQPERRRPPRRPGRGARRRIQDRLGTKAADQGKPTCEERAERAEPENAQGGAGQRAVRPPVCGTDTVRPPMRGSEHGNGAAGDEPRPCTGTQDTHVTDAKKVHFAVLPKVANVHARALRDSGSQRHVVPEAVPTTKSRPTREGEGECSGCTGHRQKAEAMGTLWLHDQASMTVVKLSNVPQKNGCVPIMNDDRFQDETHLHFRRAPGGVGERHGRDRTWRCAKGDQGSECIRGVPVTKTGKGGMAVSDLPDETVHWSEAEGEHVPMFPRSAAKKARGAQVHSIASEGERAWRGPPRTTVTECGQAVPMEEASNQSVAEALEKAQEADAVFVWLPKLQPRSGKTQVNFKMKKKFRAFKNWVRQLTQEKEA